MSGKVQNHLIIENDFKNEEIEPFAYENPDSLTPEELVGAIKEIGILGPGRFGISYICKI